jgi:hypothetical protein
MNTFIPYLPSKEELIEKLYHAVLLKRFHLKCQHRFTHPLLWDEQLSSINQYIDILREEFFEVDQYVSFTLTNRKVE